MDDIRREGDISYLSNAIYLQPAAKNFDLDQCSEENFILCGKNTVVALILLIYL